MEKLNLVIPSLVYKQSFMDYANEYMLLQDENASLYKDMYGKGLDNFNMYLSFLEDRANGIGIPEGWTATFSFWLVNHINEIVGVVRIRPDIKTDLLSKYVGHIGYDIKPSERSKGYGSEILRLGLLELQKYGVGDVLVICSKQNHISRRVIEKNNGIFESEIIAPDDDVYLRYWIKQNNSQVDKCNCR